MVPIHASSMRVVVVFIPSGTPGFSIIVNLKLCDSCFQILDGGCKNIILMGLDLMGAPPSCTIPEVSIAIIFELIQTFLKIFFQELDKDLVVIMMNTLD